jgi:hypothetical protein
MPEKQLNDYEMSRYHDKQCSLTRQTLDGLLRAKPVEWVDEVFEIVSNMLMDIGYFDEEPGARTLLKNLPRGLQYVYHLVSLDSEVNNGGFRQFLTNWNEPTEALAALKAIGATDITSLLESAISAYVSSLGTAGLDTEIANWPKLLTFEWPELRELDLEYHYISESTDYRLFKLLDLYARKHPSEFVYDVAP